MQFHYTHQLVRVNIMAWANLSAKETNRESHKYMSPPSIFLTTRFFFHCEDGKAICRPFSDEIDRIILEYFIAFYCSIKTMQNLQAI